VFAVTVTRRYTTYENSIVRYDMVYEKVLVSQCSQINNWDWYRGLIQDVFYSLRPAAKKKNNPGCLHRGRSDVVEGVQIDNGSQVMFNIYAPWRMVRWCRETPHLQRIDGLMA
jgi:hypothetical protein